MKLLQAYLTTFAIIATLTVASGCASGGNSPSSDSFEPDTVNGEQSAADQNVPNPPQINESTLPKPNPETAPGNTSKDDKETDTPAAPVQAVPKKLYRMNGVYSFVPINKEATTGKVVLLTFDDGPKADKTLGSLLDTLDKHHAKAIFFVNGYRVKSHPELLKKIADRGQTIGNHSWDHIDLKKEKETTVKKQIGDVQDIVKKITGKYPQFFRPPFGSDNDAVKGIVRADGMLYMTWSNGSLDWDSSTKNKPDKVIANVLDQLHPGVNILMHELPWTTEALDSLLTKLEAKGYGFIDPSTIEINPKSPPKSAK